MEKQTRRKFTAEFKTKVVLEALKERSTIEQIAKKYEVHPNQISGWKKEFLSKATQVFGSGNGSEAHDSEAVQERLYAQIGQLKVENDFLKKKLF